MDAIYPDCNAPERVVSLGGLAKPELIHALENAAISLNPLAERLLQSDFFASPPRADVTTVVLTVANLGFPDGAIIADIFREALRLGLSLCPIELGPYYRLQYRDQPEGSRGKPVLEHQAPYGSITIASAVLTEDDDFPKGFYLRRIEDVLWLRGYRSSADHVWSPDD